MNRKFAAIIVLSLACAVRLSAQVENRELKSGKKRIGSIVLMPLNVSLSRMTMKGSEPMIDEAREAELPLSLEVEAVLRDLGYRLDMETLAPEAIGKDPEQRYALDDVQKRFDTELELMHRESKGVRKGRFTLGDEVLKLPLSDKVDALLFVRARAQMLTGNKKAFGALVAGPSNDTTAMDFGLVDAKSGEVLYFGKFKMPANLLWDSTEISAGIAKAFSNLPKTGSPLASVLRDVAPSNSSSDLPIRRIRLSNTAVKGLLVQKVNPEYPGIALASHTDGDVSMWIVIDRNGHVADVAGITGPVQLIPAATAAVRKWRYRPLTVRGQVYEVETPVTESFRLEP